MSSNSVTPPPGLSPSEKASVIVTVVLLVILSTIAAVSSHNHYVLPLAVSVGGIGGLIHEIAQSRGRILFFQRFQDGMYLGSVAGVILGAVAGVLAIRGYVANGAATVDTTQITYEIFLAGLALKGVVEAAGGNAVPRETK